MELMRYSLHQNLVQVVGIAEVSFSASSNATSLVFTTASSLTDAGLHLVKGHSPLVMLFMLVSKT